MWEFLQANSNVILTIVFVGFMLWMHLGMGHGSHGGHAAHDDQPQTTPPDAPPAGRATDHAAHTEQATTTNTTRPSCH